MNSKLFLVLVSFSGCVLSAPNKAKGGHLEGKAHAGVSHYGTDMNKIMQGMVEVSRGGGQRVYFKSEPTAHGHIETRIFLPDTEGGVPQGLSQVGDTQRVFESPEQTVGQQDLPAQIGPEQEMNLPDKQFVS